MGIIGEISIPQPENLLVKCEVTLAADSTCQPCASSDVYGLQLCNGSDDSEFFDWVIRPLFFGYVAITWFGCKGNVRLP